MISGMTVVSMHDTVSVHMAIAVVSRHFLIIPTTMIQSASCTKGETHELMGADLSQAKYQSTLMPTTYVQETGTRKLVPKSGMCIMQSSTNYFLVPEKTGTRLHDTHTRFWYQDLVLVSCTYAMGIKNHWWEPKRCT